MSQFQNVLLIRAGSTAPKKGGHPVHNPAPLSLKYAQTFIEQKGVNHTHLLDYWVDELSFDDLLLYIDQHAINFVVVSISSPSSEAGISLCAKLKEHRDLFVVIVGSDVSEKHEYYLTLSATFDVLIRGEYEKEVGDLFERLNSTEDMAEIKEHYNYVKSRESLRVEDLDELPSLIWDDIELIKYPYIYPLRFNRRVLSGYISTSRGCPHACTFCSPTVRKSYGRRLRMRSAQRVVDDIEQLTKLGVNVISFEDDDFTLNKDHVREICEEIINRRLKVKWACHARVDEVTPDLLTIMKKAGCALLLFGIESGSQRIVNILHKASAQVGWHKKATVAFKHVRAAGIASCAMFIVGSPTETIVDVNQSIDLSFDMKPDLIKVHFFTLYPGSVDYKNYQERNNGPMSPYHYLKPVVNLSHMDLIALKKIQRKFYRQFLFRPSFLLAHLYHYLPFYLCNTPRSWELVISGLKFLFFPEKVKHEQKIGSGEMKQVELY